MTHRRLKVTQQVGNDPGFVLEPAYECYSSGCYPKMTSLTTTPSKLNILQSSTPAFFQVNVIKDNKQVPERVIGRMGKAEMGSEI